MEASNQSSSRPHVNTGFAHMHNGPDFYWAFIRQAELAPVNLVEPQSFPRRQKRQAGRGARPRSKFGLNLRDAFMLPYPSPK